MDIGYKWTIDIRYRNRQWTLGQKWIIDILDTEMDSLHWRQKWTLETNR